MIQLYNILILIILTSLTILVTIQQLYKNLNRDSFDNEPNINRNFNNFLQFIYQHSHIKEYKLLS